MAILSIHGDNPLKDGRQSARALAIRRGMQRLLIDMRHVTLPELSLRSGRRADIVTLSEKGEIWIIEIKSSIEDFRVDRKWPEYRNFCDRLYFATLPDVPEAIFPEDAGLFIADQYGAELIRDAPEHRLAPATRKSMTLNFSRIAAARLMHAEWAADRLGIPNPNQPGESESPDF
ncbi:MmcB family DNA repair protein [Rhizobium sp. TH2]|uniref:MmcB family DNA repair protein n=1 Tax=Rhizobium sp. TH2 TaxID=2775403 RepID=UPI0021579E2F|nr:MmcB family DNA repair protein [Rhizobium sp. TH2]UVC08531.1 MmcB family DNA repair protein [Rhizobium sp. TH2]